MKRIQVVGVVTVSLCMMFGLSANAISAPLTENIGKGTLDWSSGEMSATGVGVPPERYKNQPARGRIMASRAARVDALRNLYEAMGGVRVEAKTLVKDMAVESDVIRTTMAGSVRNASMVGRPNYMPDGSVEVTMAINYRQSIAKTIVEQKNDIASVPTLPTTSNKSIITGLVIDAVGMGLHTALSPRILDEDGNIIYSASMVVQDHRNDVVAYNTSTQDAAQLSRLGGNVLTIKALKISEKTDVVISHADAVKVGQTSGMADILRQAHVAFAL